MRKANPVLAKGFEKNLSFTGNKMTLEGTANKTLFLILLTFLTGVLGWNSNATVPVSTLFTLLKIAPFICLGLAIVITLNNKLCPVLSPVYALIEGYILGIISYFFNQQYEGIVIQALIVTFLILVSLLIIYKLKIIKATENFKLMIACATMGIALLYLIQIVAAFLGINLFPFIHESGSLGIFFSIFVVAIASLNLVLDFDFIENGVEKGFPKYMEWYGAFGLLITLIWVYIEVLRLLAKLSKNRK